MTRAVVCVTTGKETRDGGPGTEMGGHMDSGDSGKMRGITGTVERSEG